jgi:hypothetical protein
MVHPDACAVGFRARALNLSAAEELYGWDVFGD